MAEMYILLLVFGPWCLLGALIYGRMLTSAEYKIWNTFVALYHIFALRYRAT